MEPGFPLTRRSSALKATGKTDCRIDVFADGRDDNFY